MHDYEAMIASTTQLNTLGPALACLDGVHALTDVTGFGLGGHLLEICKASASLPVSTSTRCRSCRTHSITRVRVSLPVPRRATCRATARC